MFRQILYTQWTWARWLVLLGVVAGFAIPVASVQHAGDPLRDLWAARDVLSAMQTYSPLYALLAATVGLLLGMSAWAADHRGRHVYALSLPMPRWNYALLRYGAGVVLLLAPVFAVWIGALVASAAATLPAGLHAYPTGVALRFALGALLAYTIIFAIAAGTTRTAGIVLGVILGLIMADVVGGLAGAHLNATSTVADWLFTGHGLFEVFTGRWMLIDV